MLRDIAVEQLQVEKVQNREDEFIREVLSDFWICCVSREASILINSSAASGFSRMTPMN